MTSEIKKFVCGVLEIKEGDVLVLKVSDISAIQLERFKTELAKFLGFSVPILALRPGEDVSIIRSK